MSAVPEIPEIGFRDHRVVRSVEPCRTVRVTRSTHRADPSRPRRRTCRLRALPDASAAAVPLDSPNRQYTDGASANTAARIRRRPARPGVGRRVGRVRGRDVERVRRRPTVRPALEGVRDAADGLGQRRVQLHLRVHDPDWLNGVGGLCSDPAATASPAGLLWILRAPSTGRCAGSTLAVAPTASVAVKRELDVRRRLVIRCRRSCRRSGARGERMLVATQSRAMAEDDVPRQPRRRLHAVLGVTRTPGEADRVARLPAEPRAAAWR